MAGEKPEDEWKKAQAGWDARREAVGAIPPSPKVQNPIDFHDTPQTGSVEFEARAQPNAITEDDIRAVAELARSVSPEETSKKLAGPLKILGDAAKQLYLDALHSGASSRVQEQIEDRRALRAEIAKNVESSGKPAVPSPPAPTPAPAETSNPMHVRDKHFYSVLGWSIAWAAIPGSILVGLVLGMAASQIPSQVGVPGIVGSVLVMVGLTIFGFKQELPDLKNPGPIMTIIALLTWAFVGWQTWMFFHSASQTSSQILNPSNSNVLSSGDGGGGGPSKAPNPTGETNGQSLGNQSDANTNSAPNVVNVSPDYLMSLFEGKMSSQGQMLLAPYIGRWLILNVKVEDISNNTIWTYIRKPNLLRTITMHFDQSWTDQLAVLTHNQDVTALCQITKLAAVNAIRFEHCELEPSNR